MRKNKERYLLYIGICLVLFPVLLLRDFTPANELRYLSIADEALRNHIFFTFTNHGEPYADKPPLYLWLVMICRWLTDSHQMWLLALFSLLPAMGIMHTMNKWTLHEMDSESRTLACLILFTSGIFIGAAVTLRMDMLMCFFIVLALHAFWQMLKNTDEYRRYSRLFPLYLFLAVFTKGPLGLLIPFCCTTVFLAITKRLGQFFRYWGIRTWGILLVCCAIWFGAVYAEGGSSYLYNLLFHQTIDRAVNSFHHNEPFYYYAVCIWYSMAPWALLVIGVSIAALRRTFVCSDLQKFFLTVGIVTFILLSCISAKLQIYMLPIIPFLVYATAMSVPRFNGNGWIRISIAVPATIFAMALPILFLTKAFGNIPFPDEMIFYIAAAILTVSGLSALYRLYGKKQTFDISKSVYRIGIGILFTIFTIGWALPKLNTDIGYGKLCNNVLKLSQETGITDFRTWHLARSENMDVYMNSPVQIVMGKEVPTSNNNEPFILMIPSKDLTYFPDKETWTVGKYAIVLFPKGNTQKMTISYNEN